MIGEGDIATKSGITIYGIAIQCIALNRIRSGLVPI